MVESNARLLEPHEHALLGPPGATRALPIDLIDPNPQNPRRAYAEIEDLAASIKQFGLLQPVTVRPNGERFELLGGHRRRLAVLLLADQEPHEPKWRVIESVIKVFDDDTAYLALLAGQLHSKSWAPREEAAALERLAETRTYKEVGRLVHKSEAWAGKRLAIYADAVLSGYVQTGQLKPSVAQELLPIRDAAVRREFAERAAHEQWGLAEARQAVRTLRSSRMVAQIGRLASQLLEALALVQPGQMPRETGETLLAVRRRIMALAHGGPVIPTIEAAQQAAGVNPGRPARPRQPRGYRKGFGPKR